MLYRRLWIYGNHKPLVRGTDLGIWRRIHLVPSEVTLDPHKIDPELLHKLVGPQTSDRAGELPGILAWAVRGCLDWARDGLQVPGAVRTATQSYREDMDEIGRFLADCCVLADGATVTKGALYEAYERWGGGVSKRGLSLKLKEQGFTDARVTGGVHVWCGIGLLKDAPAPLGGL